MRNPIRKLLRIYQRGEQFSVKLSGKFPQGSYRLVLQMLFFKKSEVRSPKSSQPFPPFSRFPLSIKKIRIMNPELMKALEQVQKMQEEVSKAQETLSTI